MLSEKRIKEAESNVKNYLEEGLLKKQNNKTAKEMYIENSDLSLGDSFFLLCYVLYCECSLNQSWLQGWR